MRLIHQGKLLLLPLAAFLAACNVTANPSPEDTAKRFLEAAHSGDPQAVKMFINERNPALFMLGSQVYTRVAEGAKGETRKHGAIKSIDTNVVAQNGGNALVEASVTYEDGFVGTGNIPVEEVEGRWYYAPSQRN